MPRSPRRRAGRRSEDCRERRAGRPGIPVGVRGHRARGRRAAGRARDRRAYGIRASRAKGWTGRASATTRRRARRWLAEATDATPAQLDRVGRVLQDHATDLADLVARARASRSAPGRRGSSVRDGRVELAWGVTGTADAEADRAREAARAALQAELDLVLAQHRRRRDWVLGVLRDSTSGAVRPLAPAAQWMRGSPDRRARGRQRATDDA